MTVWTYPRLFMADIVAEVSHVFGISKDVIKGPRRFRSIVRPRFACYYLAKQLTSLPYSGIGQRLGGRDHSSVMSGESSAINFMEREPEYRAYVDAVRIRLLTRREREVQRGQEVLAVARERARLEMLAAEKAAQEKAEAEALAVPPTLIGEMDELSDAVAAFVAAGGSFVEVRV